MSAIASTVPAVTCAVGKSSHVLGAMAAGHTYRIACTVDAWITFGGDPDAVAGAEGGHFVPASAPLEVRCTRDTRVAIVRDRARDGRASLSTVV